MDEQTSPTGKYYHLIRRYAFFAIFFAAIFFLMPLKADAATWEVDSPSSFGTNLGNFKNGAAGYASGDTFKLTADITYTGNIYLDAKELNIDLNGYTLTLSNNDISVDNGAVINTVGEGEFNIDSPNYGRVNANGAGSALTVSNIISSTYGAVASNGGTITVNGDITVNTSLLSVAGAIVDTGTGTITVNGDIYVTGDYCSGVEVSTTTPGTEITVDGNVTVAGAYGIGVDISRAAATVTVNGDVTAEYAGVMISTSYSGSTVTVGGDVSSTLPADGGRGASIAFGSNHTITVGGDVTVASNGNTAWGISVNVTTDSRIDVAGSVIMTGDSATGAYVGGTGSSNNQITVNGDISAVWKSLEIRSSGTKGIEVSGTNDSVTVLGSVEATGCGIDAKSGGTADVTGSVTVSPPEDSYYYNAVDCRGGTVTIGGDLSVTRNGSTYAARGIYLNSGTVSVAGDVSAMSSAGNVDSIYISVSGTVNVGGDVIASGIGTNYITGIYSSGGSATVDGTVSADGSSNCIGVNVSGGGTFVFNKAIFAATYIRAYTPSTVTYNVGSGILNAGYYEYDCGGATVQVKAWDLTVEAETGGTACIGATELTSGSYEAGTPIGLLATDTVSGYDFDKWTSSDGGSFTDVNSPTAIFTMPAASAIVTAEFKSVNTYDIDTSGIVGGTVTASPNPA